MTAYMGTKTIVTTVPSKMLKLKILERFGQILPTFNNKIGQIMLNLMQNVKNFCPKNSLLFQPLTSEAKFWAKFVVSGEKVWANFYQNFNSGNFAVVKILKGTLIVITVHTYR